MISTEWPRIWVPQISQIEIQKGWPNDSAVLQNWFPQEIRSPLFHLRKFKKNDKSTAESCRMHWNLLNDQEFGSLKFLKLKYRRGDQMIRPFCRIGSPKKLGPPSFIWENFKKMTKVLLNHVECIEIYWVTKNLGSLNFSNWNTEGGTK